MAWSNNLVRIEAPGWSTPLSTLRYAIHGGGTEENTEECWKVQGINISGESIISLIWGQFAREHRMGGFILQRQTSYF